ncbi:MAG TPA: MgtC/SapB family protein [Herpetosiphonaceae bacterium]|nr:MgtC/SapB family protein [Herpetosiphonaceae bacterium]
MNVVLNWGNIIAHFVSLAIAYGLAFPIGWDREKGSRSAGLRTFPLVAMASCGFIIIAQQVARESPEAQARIIEEQRRLIRLTPLDAWPVAEAASDLGT